MAKLRRVSDGAGDEGSECQCIEWNEDRTVKQVVGRRPVVGCSMLVGSPIARSYFAKQDYWLTTVITEILEERDDYVRFKTTNSEYELWL